MAKVSGAAAYQQLQPTNDGLSQSSQYWGAMGMNMAQQNRRINQIDKESRRRQQAEEQKAFDEKFAKSNETLKLFDTKHKQGNDIVAAGVFRLKEENARAHAILDPRNRQNTTPQERFEAQMKIQRIQEYIPMMKMAMSGITEHITKSNEAISTGNFIGNPEYNEFTKTFSELGEGSRVVDVAIGNDGEMYVVYKDEDSNDTPKQILLKDLAQGKFPEPTPYVDYNELVKFGIEKAGTFTKKYSEGFDDITKTDLNEESKTMLKSDAEDYFKINEDGRPSPGLVSFLHQAGVDAYSLSPEKLEEFSERLRIKYYGDVSASIKREDSRKRNHSAALAQRKYDDEGDKTSSSGVGFVVDSQSGRITERKITDDNGVQRTAYALKNENKGNPFVIHTTKNSETRTENLYITAGGKIYGDVYTIERGKEEDFTSSGYTSTGEVISDPESRWLTSEEANRIATERGYKNARDMYLRLDEERKQYGNQSPQSTQIKFN